MSRKFQLAYKYHQYLPQLAWACQVKKTYVLISIFKWKQVKGFLNHQHSWFLVPCTSGQLNAAKDQESFPLRTQLVGALFL